MTVVGWEIASGWEAVSVRAVMVVGWEIALGWEARQGRGWETASGWQVGAAGRSAMGAIR